MSSFSFIMLYCLNLLTEFSYLFLYFAVLSSEYETWPVIYKSGEKQMANLLWYNEGKCFSVKSKLQKKNNLYFFREIKMIFFFTTKACMWISRLDT